MSSLSFFFADLDDNRKQPSFGLVCAINRPGQNARSVAQGWPNGCIQGRRRRVQSIVNVVRFLYLGSVNILSIKRKERKT